MFYISEHYSNMKFDASNLSVVPLQPPNIEGMDDEEPDWSKPWWEAGICNWNLVKSIDENTIDLSNVTGNCGLRASKVGHNQKVFSLTLFGMSEDYWKNLGSLLRSVKVFYPGWMVRLHTTPRYYQAQLCPLIQNHDHLFICDIENLPGNQKLTHSNPLMWRMAPIGDPQVRYFLGRDLDSMVQY